MFACHSRERLSSGRCKHVALGLQPPSPQPPRHRNERDCAELAPTYWSAQPSATGLMMVDGSRKGGTARPLLTRTGELTRFGTLSYQLVANAHILRLCLIIADTLSWDVQRQSYQYSQAAASALAGRAAHRGAEQGHPKPASACCGGAAVACAYHGRLW